MTPPHQSTPSSVLHRRPAYAVNSPSILCHRCYHARSPSGDGRPLPDADPTIALNDILYDIQLAGRPAGARSKILSFGTARAAAGRLPAGVTEEKVGSEETILVNLYVLDGEPEWAGWRARMRVDLHPEYYSVTFILDRSKLTTELKRSPDDLPARTKDAAGDFVYEWYTTRWKHFFDLLKAKGAGRDFPQDRQFYECRGLVLDTAPPQPARPKTPIIDRRAFEQERQDAKEQIETWVDANHDLMAEVLRLDRSQPWDQDANCILCSVMSGRGVYASSMGRTEAELRDIKERDIKEEEGLAGPERYLLLHHGLPRFMVGRVLRQFHVLDELRSASIFDLTELLAAGNGVRKVGAKIDTQSRSGARELTPQQLREIQRELNQLAANEKVGGLLYRINRSRYYARLFRQSLQDLRLVRVQGWESYDTFMHRNLFPLIDRIDSIGVRFEALAARVEQLTAARNLEELVYIQKIGEIIGWTAAAYYGGQIIGKLLHVLPHDCAICDVKLLDICVLFSWLGHDTVGMLISIPLAYYLYRKFKFGEHRRSKAVGSSV